MNRLPLALLSAALPLALAAPTAASGAQFGPSHPLGMTATGPIVASIGARGEAAVAGLDGSRPTGTYVDVATRPSGTPAWKVGAIGPVAPQARDVQVVVTRDRAVVAWAQARGRDQRVVVATGSLGGKLTVRARIAVGDAYAASPRLARMSNDEVVVAWRDGAYKRGSRVRIMRIDGDRIGSAPRTVGRDVAQVVLAARGSGAAVGWTSAYHVRPGTRPGSPRRALPRTLTVVSLDYRAAPGATTVVGRDVGSTARLAGASDGRLVASWVRPTQIRPYPGEDRGDRPPADAYVMPRAFTRQVLPRVRPARPVGDAQQVAQGPPSVAFDGADGAIAVMRAAAPNTAPPYDVFGARARDGGPWSVPQRIVDLGFTRMDPIVAVPAAGDGVVVYTALDPSTSAPRWIVAANDAAGAHGLGTTSAGDGQGATVASAPGDVLVAWNDGDQVQVAERG